MQIPDYQTVMLPLLRLAAVEKDYRVRDAIDRLGVEFQLSKVELGELLPSGTSTVFGSRVAWARTYLKQAGLLQTPKEGYVPNYRPRARIACGETGARRRQTVGSVR